MTVAVQNLKDIIEQSLSVEAPDFDSVADEIDLVETELMKKGTLAYFDIDWIATYAQALKVLSAGTHIDSVAAASMAVIQEAPIEDLPEFTTLLSGFLGDQWAQIHPQNVKFDKLKTTRFQELLDTIPKRLQKEPLQHEGFEDIINQLKSRAKTRGLDVASLDALHIEKPTVAEDAPSENAIPAQPAQIGGAEPVAGSGYTADLDAKGRSQLKRDVVALAERIEAFRVKDPTPYYLRGFAATIEIKTAPEADENGVTQMNAMPGEIRDPFEHALSNPTIQTLKQLEQRLLNSPDWFEGQGFAAEMARKLNMPIVSTAIAHRVQNRLQALPEFLEIKYSNGTEFLPHQARSVLLDSSAVAAKVSSGNGGNQEATSRIEQLREAEKEGGLAAAMELLEMAHKEAKSKRDKAILALDRAEFMLENEYTNLAEDSLNTVVRYFESEDLRAWDTVLFSRLKNLQNRVNKDEI